jgi:hypothetical protein
VAELGRHPIKKESSLAVKRGEMSPEQVEATAWLAARMIHDFVAESEAGQEKKGTKIEHY